jgi:hypothetical protein
MEKRKMKQNVRIAVSVATGLHYVLKQERLLDALLRDPCHPCSSYFWTNALPPGSPSHEAVPYGFKAYALEQAARLVPNDPPTLMWMDSSIYLVKSLEPLWQSIESRGYWFSNNPPWNCGEWTCDSALEPLGITREEAFDIPQVIATCFGLDMRHEIAREFLKEYKRLADTPGAFQGPWTNENGQASKDPRVKGHRHDQTAASVIAYRLGMKLTEPPKWILNCGPGTEETVIEIRR